MNPFYDLNKKLASIGNEQEQIKTEVAKAAEKTPARKTLEESLRSDMKSLMEDASGGMAQSNTLETKSYSAKKAAAGKDIGKPGKNFDKIAKSAGKKYGSKAAGERVAGAVLNKLRHTNEGESCQACQEGACQTHTPSKGQDVSDKSWLKTAGKKPGPLHNVVKGLKAFVKGEPEPMDEEQEGRPYVVVHARKGKTEVYANSSYDAVKKAASKWGLKNTAGLDAYLADVKHTAVDEDEEMMQYLKHKASRAVAHPYNGGGHADAYSGAQFEGEASLEEAVSRKHFQQVADLLRNIPDEAKRKEMALHHAHIFKQQNPRFDLRRFAQAAGVNLDECAMWEELKGGQKKLDRNHDGKLSAQDFAMLRGEKVDESSADDIYDQCFIKAQEMIDNGASPGEALSVIQSKLEVRGYDEDTIDQIISDLEGSLDFGQVDEAWPSQEQMRSMFSTPKGQTASGRHDIRDTGYSKIYTRKMSDEPEGDDEPTADAPKRGRGRPKSSKPQEKRVTKGAWKHKAKEGKEEELDEKSVSQAQARTMAGAAHNPKFAKKVGISQKVAKEFNKADKGKDISKLPKKAKKTDEAAKPDYIDLDKDGNKKESMKKAAKDKKEKKVDETTTSGSVATSAATHKEAAAMGVGKGIYDSINFEKMIQESMKLSVECAMDGAVHEHAVDGDEESLTVTATGDDVAKLRQALQALGIQGSAAGHTEHDHEGPCPKCGGVPCQCDELGQEVEVVGLPGEIEFDVSEGDLGKVAGTVAGTALGGPVGGAIGGVIGDKLTDENTKLSERKIAIDSDDEEFNPREGDVIVGTVLGDVKLLEITEEDLYGQFAEGIVQTQDGRKFKVSFESLLGNEDPEQIAEADAPVTDNEPDWPTNQEYSDDALQYSGGLNGPKSTGQATTPILASQKDRQMSESEDRSFFSLVKAMIVK